MFSQVKVPYVIVPDSNLEILTIPGIFLLKNSQQKKTPNTQTKTQTPISQLAKQRFWIYGNISVIRNGKIQTCEIKVKEICIQNRNSLALMALFRFPFYTCSNTTSNFGEKLCRVKDLLIHQRIILVLCQCNMVLQRLNIYLLSVIRQLHIQIR